MEDKFDEGLSYIQQAAEMDPSDKQLVAWNAWALLWGWLYAYSECIFMIDKSSQIPRDVKKT